MPLATVMVVPIVADITGSFALAAFGYVLAGITPSPRPNLARCSSSGLGKARSFSGRPTEASVIEAPGRARNVKVPSTLRSLNAPACSVYEPRKNLAPAASQSLYDVL